MVTEFNLENRNFYPTSESLISEKIRSFFKSFEEYPAPLTSESSKNSREILHFLKEKSTQEFLNHSGYFLLIDELLTRGESANNPENSKKLFALALKLLCKSPGSLTIIPSNENLCEEFIGKILETAEIVSQFSSYAPEPFRESARDLKMKLNNLFEIISKKLETSGPNISETIQQFIASWQAFTTLSFEERLKSPGVYTHLE